jgi:hypothetical protein
LLAQAIDRKLTVDELAKGKKDGKYFKKLNKLNN